MTTLRQALTESLVALMVGAAIISSLLYAFSQNGV